MAARAVLTLAWARRRLAVATSTLIGDGAGWRRAVAWVSARSALARSALRSARAASGESCQRIAEYHGTATMSRADQQHAQPGREDDLAGTWPAHA